MQDKIEKIRLSDIDIDLDSKEAIAEILKHQIKLQKEFEKLLEAKEKSENIPNTIDMTLQFQDQELKWTLSIENTELVNEYFGRLVEGMRKKNERSEELLDY